MTDQLNAPDGATPEDKGIAALPEEVQGYIRSLREEAKSHRIAAKEASDGLSAMQAQLDQLKAKSEAERLKTVEELQGAVVENQTALQKAQAEVKAFKDSFAASNEKRIAAIPERMRTMVPDFGDPVKVSQWLDANASLLKVDLPGTDAGEHGPNPPEGAKLSQEEIRAARLLGVDPNLAVKFK